MCGRYQAWIEDDALMRIIEREKRGNTLRYFRRNEVFPGTVLPVLYGSYANVRAHLSTWGHPMEGEGFAENTNVLSSRSRHLINARAETAASKPMFRHSMENNSPTDRRVIILTSGYYEWKTTVTDDGRKRKLRCHLRPAQVGNVLLLAGLETTFGEDDHHHVILTTAACGTPSEIHDRMPLILHRDEIRPWLYDKDFALSRLRENRPVSLLVQTAE